ncbi:hypothetical protein [Sinorhizobium fredii]|uniref:hypothetical protein n=1 Tax=Rhizobium fredii TaxID=380 RepID=UPI0004B26B56|nr:hypothetical protein [Sinorhizobium fredii]AWM23755.1 hypothetical protein AOX55_0000475 [Sinorhizobium fredii CCBAU 25509]
MEDERGKVIPFDRYLRLEAQQKARDAMARRQQQDREALFATQERACADEKMMNDDADRLLVAKNLFRILQRFEQETGQRKVDVVRAANIGSEEDSTKRLEYYTIDPDKPTSSKRVEKLARRIRNYKKLARKAAELANWEWHDILIDLFQGSSFFPDSEDPGLYGTHIRILHRLLDTMGEWLRRKTAIDWYFAKLRELPLFDEWGNFIVNDDPICTVLQNRAVAVGDPWLFLNLTIPSVRLYRQLIESQPVDFGSGEGLPDDLRYDDEPPEMVVVQRLEFRSYREVRLGIAPQSWSRPPEIVFEERLICELWEQDNLRGWLPYSPDGPGSEWTQMEYHLRLPAVDVYPDIRSAENAVERYKLCWVRDASRKSGRGHQSRKSSFLRDRNTEGATFSFGPVKQFVQRAGLKNCARFLDVSRGDTSKLDLTSFAFGTVYESPPNTVAAALEIDLYAGMDEAEAGGASEEDDDQIEFPLRVDLRLKQEIDRRCGLLERCWEERNVLLDRQRQDLLARWGLDGDSP